MKSTENPFLSISPEVEEIVTRLQESIYTVKETSLTYRTLNHYQSLGILDATKISKNSWRKFNGLELVWIRIVIQLRDLGVSLDKIIILKDHLFNYGSLGSIDKANYITNSFEREIALAIYMRYNLHLIIFSNFSYTFHDSTNIRQLSLKPYLLEPSINLPLHNAIKEIWPIKK